MLLRRFDRGVLLSDFAISIAHPFVSERACFRRIHIVSRYYFSKKKLLFRLLLFYISHSRGIPIKILIFREQSSLLDAILVFCMTRARFRDSFYQRLEIEIFDSRRRVARELIGNRGISCDITYIHIPISITRELVFAAPAKSTREKSASPPLVCLPARD